VRGSSPTPHLIHQAWVTSTVSRVRYATILTRSVLAFGCAPHAASGRALDTVFVPNLEACSRGLLAGRPVASLLFFGRNLMPWLTASADALAHRLCTGRSVIHGPDLWESASRAYATRERTFPQAARSAGAVDNAASGGGAVVVFPLACITLVNPIRKDGQASGTYNQ
jgi:hypothetical protein